MTIRRFSRIYTYSVKEDFSLSLDIWLLKLETLRGNRSIYQNLFGVKKFVREENVVDILTSIVRLELEADLIAARLVKTILQEIKMSFSNISLWSDSTAVLKYIKNREMQFEKYVLRYTQENNSVTNYKKWNYMIICWWSDQMH